MSIGRQKERSGRKVARMIQKSIGLYDLLNGLLPTVVGTLACWKEDPRASCCQIVAYVDRARRQAIDRPLSDRRSQRLPATNSIVIATIITITTTTTIITITNVSRPLLLLLRLLLFPAPITLCYRHHHQRHLLFSPPTFRRRLFHGLEAATSSTSRMHDDVVLYYSNLSLSLYRSQDMVVTVAAYSDELLF